MHRILTDIFKGVSFTENEEALIISKLKETTINKGQFLVKAAEKITDLYYIDEGCLRTYFIDESGKEHTLQFAIKGWWISDYIALFGHKKEKAVCYIECIKESRLFHISKKDFDTLCLEVPTIGQVHIRNLESAFAHFQQRILENMTLSAKARYINFSKVYPNIEQNVKNYHIASFLGITTESLSRIRKELSSE